MGLPAAIRDYEQVTNSFFRSLGYLSDHFGFTPKDFAREVYPYNIHLAFEDAKEQLAAVDPFCSLRIVQDKSHPACIDCIHNAGTGSSLFYIPIEPLYLLNKEPGKRRTVNLLLSVFAYLYRTGVTYYRNEGDFLYYEYEMMKNWYQEMYSDDGEESSEEALAELDLAQKQGDRFWRKITSKKNLKAFERRLQRFQPASHWEEQLLILAVSVMQLAKEYPGSTYFDNIQPALMEDGDEDDRAMRPEHYLSFFWSADGVVYDQLMQCVNNELGEMYGVEEPVQDQLFDRHGEDIRVLDFEKRYLNLIDELCYLLNQ